jgi:hypothetical protein
LVGSGRTRDSGIVIHRPGTLGGEILIERSPHRHVDELNASADAEDRHRCRAGGGKERQFEPIPLEVHRAEAADGSAP